MASIHDNYVQISVDMLPKEKNIFAFHLYVFNPMTQEYSPFLMANNPLTEGKEKFLKYILNKGGRIAVAKTQRNSFLQDANLVAEEVPGMLKPVQHELEKARAMYQQILKDKIEKEVEPFEFSKECRIAVKTDNFDKLIERAHDEILTFSVKTSHTVSLAIYLTELLLTKDNLTNRIVAVSYFLAKTLDISSYEVLSDLIVAAYLHHVGNTQLDQSLSHAPTFKMYEDDLKRYKKHPGLAFHLLKKSGVELSPRCIRIILEHHERSDGSGYPSEKMIDHIEPASLILGAVSHVFEFSEGKITGQKQPLESVIKKIKNRTSTPGLDFTFDGRIYETLGKILEEQIKVKAA